MFLVHKALRDLEGTQVHLDHQENQATEVLDPKESRGCQDHRDHQAMGSQVCQDFQENQEREDRMDQKEILDQLVYLDHGAHQDHLESLAQLEFLFQESQGNREPQEPQDPGAFLEKRVHQESLEGMDRKGKMDTVLLAVLVRGAFQALRVPWDRLVLLEWEKEAKMGFQDSQASKVIGVFQEKEDQMAHQAPKVLLGNADQKVLESQELLDPQASQGFQEPKVTLGLQE